MSIRSKNNPNHPFRVPPYIPGGSEPGADRTMEAAAPGARLRICTRRMGSAFMCCGIAARNWATAGEPAPEHPAGEGAGRGPDPSGDPLLRVDQLTIDHKLSTSHEGSRRSLPQSCKRSSISSLTTWTDGHQPLQRRSVRSAMQVFFARWPSGRKVKWRSLTWQSSRSLIDNSIMTARLPSIATYTGQLCLMASSGWRSCLPGAGRTRRMDCPSIAGLESVQRRIQGRQARARNEAHRTEVKLVELRQVDHRRDLPLHLRGDRAVGCGDVLRASRLAEFVSGRKLEPGDR